MDRLSLASTQEERKVTLFTMEVLMEELEGRGRESYLTKEQRKLKSLLMCQLVEKLDDILDEFVNSNEWTQRINNILQRAATAMTEWEAEPNAPVLNNNDSAMLGQSDSAFKIPKKQISKSNLIQELEIIEKERLHSLKEMKTVERRLSVELKSKQKQKQLNFLKKKIKIEMKADQAQIALLRQSEERQNEIDEMEIEDEKSENTETTINSLSDAKDEIQRLKVMLKQKDQELIDEYDDMELMQKAVRGMKAEFGDFKNSVEQKTITSPAGEVDEFETSLVEQMDDTATEVERLNNLADLRESKIAKLTWLLKETTERHNAKEIDTKKQFQRLKKEMNQSNEEMLAKNEDVEDIKELLLQHIKFTDDHSMTIGKITEEVVNVHQQINEAVRSQELAKKKQIEKLNQTEKESKVEIAKLVADRDRLQQRLRKSEDSEKWLKSQLNLAEVSHSESMSDKEDSLEQQRDEMQQIRDELSSKMAVLDEAEQKQQELERKIGEKHSNINRLEAELETVSQQFDDFKLQYNSLQDDHQILNDVRSTLEYQKQEIDDKLESVSKEMDVLTQKHNDLLNEIETKNAIIETLKNEASDSLSNADETVQNLRKKNENLKKTMEEVMDRVKVGERELMGFKVRERELAPLISVLRKEMDRLIGRFVSNGDRGGLKSEKSVETVPEEQSDAQKIGAEIKRMTTDVVGIQQQIDALIKMLDAKDDELSRLNEVSKMKVEASTQRFEAELEEAKSMQETDTEHESFTIELQERLIDLSKTIGNQRGIEIELIRSILDMLDGKLVSVGNADNVKEQEIQRLKAMITEQDNEISNLQSLVDGSREKKWKKFLWETSAKLAMAKKELERVKKTSSEEILAKNEEVLRVKEVLYRTEQKLQDNENAVEDVEDIKELLLQHIKFTDDHTMTMGKITEEVANVHQQINDAVRSQGLLKKKVEISEIEEKSTRLISDSESTPFVTLPPFDPETEKNLNESLQEKGRELETLERELVLVGKAANVKEQVQRLKAMFTEKDNEISNLQSLVDGSRDKKWKKFLWETSAKLAMAKKELERVKKTSSEEMLAKNEEVLRVKAVLYRTEQKLQVEISELERVKVMLNQRETELETLKRKVLESQSVDDGDEVSKRVSGIAMLFDAMDKEEESQGLQLRIDDAERVIADLRLVIESKDIDIDSSSNRIEDQRAVIRKVHSEMFVLRETLIAAKRESTEKEEGAQNKVKNQKTEMNRAATNQVENVTMTAEDSTDLVHSLEQRLSQKQTEIEWMADDVRDDQMVSMFIEKEKTNELERVKSRLNERERELKESKKNKVNKVEISEIEENRTRLISDTESSPFVLVPQLDPETEKNLDESLQQKGRELEALKTELNAVRFSQKWKVCTLLSLLMLLAVAAILNTDYWDITDSDNACKMTVISQADEIQELQNELKEFSKIAKELELEVHGRRMESLQLKQSMKAKERARQQVIHDQTGVSSSDVDYQGEMNAKEAHMSTWENSFANIFIGLVGAILSFTAVSYSF